MIKTLIINKIKHWILKIVQLQLFLSIISLPILIIWGLPISILSPVGNILFGPVLTIFLFLSSLIFFCEFLYLPNSLLIDLLDLITSFWLRLLSFGSNKWLITFPLISYIFLLILPIIALIILHHKKTNNLKRSSVLIFITLISVGFFLKINFNNNSQEVSLIDNKKILIESKDNKISIIDKYEMITKSFISNNFVEYNFLPSLIKKYGHCNIDKLVIKFNNRAIKFIEILSKKTSINHIYFVINIKNKMPKHNFNKFKGIKVDFIKEFDIKNISLLS